MPKVLTALVLIACFAPASLALAAPPTVESVTKLRSLTHADRFTDAVLGAFDPAARKMVANALKDKTLTSAQQTLADAIPGKLVKIAQDEFHSPDLLAAVIKVYQDAFTQAEVDGMIKFYQSPAGLAMVDKMPEVLRQSGELHQKRRGFLAERVQQEMDRLLKEVDAAK